MTSTITCLGCGWTAEDTRGFDPDGLCQCGSCTLCQARVPPPEIPEGEICDSHYLGS